MKTVFFTLLVTAQSIYIKRDNIDIFGSTNCTLEYPIAGVEFGKFGIACLNKKEIAKNSHFVNIRYVDWVNGLITSKVYGAIMVSDGELNAPLYTDDVGSISK